MAIPQHSHGHTPRLLTLCTCSQLSPPPTALYLMPLFSPRTLWSIVVSITHCQAIVQWLPLTGFWSLPCFLFLICLSFDVTVCCYLTLPELDLNLDYVFEFVCLAFFNKTYPHLHPVSASIHDIHYKAVCCIISLCLTLFSNTNQLRLGKQSLWLAFVMPSVLCSSVCLWSELRGYWFSFSQ